MATNRIPMDQAIADLARLTGRPLCHAFATVPIPWPEADDDDDEGGVEEPY